MFENVPLCGNCNSEMIQIEGYLAFYCPYCIDEETALKTIEDEINKSNSHLKED